MEKEFILEKDRGYDHEDSKNLLKEVRGFFQGKMKMIGIEWVSEKKTAAINEDTPSHTLFVISNAKAAPYEMCNGLNDVSRILSEFENSLVKLADNLYALEDNNQGLDDDSKTSLKSYGRAVDKAVDVFGNQRKRRMARIKELSSVGELQEELRQFLSEIIANYVVTVLVDALYSRIKNHSGEIYELALVQVNRFLSENGVVTKEISVGEKLNTDYVEPTPDSADNVTDEFVKFDTIEEIRRYPYFFQDGTKLLDGTAKIWRRKD